MNTLPVSQVWSQSPVLRKSPWSTGGARYPGWSGSPFELLPLQGPVWASLVAQRVKNLPAMQGMWVWSLGWEDPLEEEMATHSSILAWGILWTKKSGGLQSVGPKSQTWLCDLNNNNNIQQVGFLLLFLRLSNFWHFNYTVSWCGSLWVHLVWTLYTPWIWVSVPFQGVFSFYFFK